VATAALVVVAALAITVHPAPSVPTDLPGVLPPVATHHVFAEPTGVTIIADAGTDGLVAVDLDGGSAQRVRYPGKLEDDRLAEVGDRLVFSTESHPLSVPLTLDGTPEPLGDEPTGQFVTAGETERVWLLYGSTSEGGRASAAGLIDIAQEAAGVAPAAAWPAGSAVIAGLADRVLVATPGQRYSLAWAPADAGTGAALEPIEDAGLCSTPAGERDDAIVVLTGAPRCDGVVRLGATGTRLPVVTVPGVHGLRILAVAPAGDRAVVTGLDDQGQDGGTWLIEFGDGTARLLSQLPPAQSSVMTFAPDGQRLFILSTRDDVTTLARYDLDTDRFEPRQIPLDPVRGASPELDAPTTTALVAVPSVLGPELPTTAAACVAPIPDPFSPEPSPAIGTTPCRVAAAASPTAPAAPGAGP
jgi:hypothetical protein